MFTRRKISAAIFCLLLSSEATVNAVAQSQTSREVRRPASNAAKAAVDEAVRTGRVERRVAAGVAASFESGKPMRALLVTSSSGSRGPEKQALSDAKADIASIPGVRIESLLADLPTTVIEIDSTEALAKLAALPDATIVADELIQRSDVESEAIVEAPVLRTIGYNGINTYIGVIDSGVDYTRYELGGCLAPGDASYCRVAILPKDFSHNADGSLYDDGVLDDSIRHGTNVAVTASAMAPRAKIIGADVFGPSGAYSSDVANAVQYMINLKRAGVPISAVNLSLGSNRPTCVDVLGVGALRSAGIVAVVAAGNSAYRNGIFTPGIASPACVPGVVSVGAVFDSPDGYVDWDDCINPNAVPDQVACFSQVSSGLSMVAPGVDITGGGVTMSGTSQAAPHVAGAIATLAAAVPAASVADLIAGVTSSQTRVFDSRIGLSFPRLSMPDALAATQARVPGATGADSFDHAVVLTGASGHVTTTAGFTAQNGEPEHGRRTGTSSTWFTWTPPSEGLATFTTSGSSFDTAMSVYFGPFDDLRNIGDNDDSSIAGDRAVVGPVFVANGYTYHIAISCGAATASCGSIDLAWSTTSASIGAARPSNDNHMQATVLAGPSGTLTQTNLFATAQSGEPAYPNGVSAHQSIWFKYVAAPASTVTFSTAGSNYDTVLSVLEGTDPSSLRPIVIHDNVGFTPENPAKNDPTSRATVVASRTGSTYWIGVSSANGHEGRANLSWTSVGSPLPQATPIVVAGPRSMAKSVGSPVGSPAVSAGRKVASPGAAVTMEPPCFDRLPPDNGQSAFVADSPLGDPVGFGDCFVLTPPTTCIHQTGHSTIAIGYDFSITVPLTGNGPTIGTHSNLPGSQFSVNRAQVCGTQQSNVTITRVTRNLVGDFTALDLSFEQSCDGAPALRGRLRYRPLSMPDDPTCVAPTSGSTALYELRGPPDLYRVNICDIYTPVSGPVAGYGDSSRLAFVPFDQNLRYAGLTGIQAMNGVRLAVGTFPITFDPAASGVKVFGPCAQLTGARGTAKIISLERNSIDQITSIEFTFECTTLEGFARGFVRLPYL
jgi:Subtilase family